MDKLLTSLSVMAAKTEAAERKILKAAEERLDAVKQQMLEMRWHALVDGRTSEEYLTFVQEVGRLQQVIALARPHYQGCKNRLISSCPS